MAFLNLKYVEQFLFYFLLVAIPFQVRKTLYAPGWMFNEWRSISVYATDVLIFALVAIWLWNSGFNIRKILNISGYMRPGISANKAVWLALAGFLIVSAVTIKNSEDWLIGLWYWVRFAEFAVFFLYLASYARRKFDLALGCYALIAGAFFQAVVAIIQFFKQGSLGLTMLWESYISSDITGIASFYISSGEKIIRAYGTTPHPNILAGYLLLAIMAFYFLALHSAKNSKLYYAYPVLLWAFFFTFARVAMFSWGVIFAIGALAIFFKQDLRRQFWDNPHNRAKVLKIFWITLIAGGLFLGFFWEETVSRILISSEEEAYALRAFYNSETVRGGINLFGHGWGDYTVWLMEMYPYIPRYMYQPVHNIYLLVYSEGGVAAGFFFAAFLIALVWRFVRATKLEGVLNLGILLVAGGMLFVGLFDHFPLTIQQGRLMFWLALGLLAWPANSLDRTS